MGYIILALLIFIFGMLSGFVVYAKRPISVYEPARDDIVKMKSGFYRGKIGIIRGCEREYDFYKSKHVHFYNCRICTEDDFLNFQINNPNEIFPPGDNVRILARDMEPYS